MEDKDLKALLETAEVATTTRGKINIRLDDVVAITAIGDNLYNLQVKREKNSSEVYIIYEGSARYVSLISGIGIRNELELL